MPPEDDTIGELVDETVADLQGQIDDINSQLIVGTLSVEDAQLQEIALGPQRTTTEEGTVEERPIKDLIDADKYLLQKQASDSPPWGIRMARVAPGGAVSGRYPSRGR